MERCTGLSKTGRRVSKLFFEQNLKFSGDEKKMLKGIALVADQQKKEVELEVSLLRRLGSKFFHSHHFQISRPSERREAPRRLHIHGHGEHGQLPRADSGIHGWRRSRLFLQQNVGKR